MLHDAMACGHYPDLNHQKHACKLCLAMQQARDISAALQTSNQTPLFMAAAAGNWMHHGLQHDWASVCVMPGHEVFHAWTSNDGCMLCCAKKNGL